MVTRPGRERLAPAHLPTLFAAHKGVSGLGAVYTPFDEGLISGAGFDCLTAEPPLSDHPFNGILDRPNVIITPHIGWASQEAMQTVWQQVISHIESFHAGRPTNVVT